jgi:hypothetical protein
MWREALVVEVVSAVVVVVGWRQVPWRRRRERRRP